MPLALDGPTDGVILSSQHVTAIQVTDEKALSHHRTDSTDCCERSDSRLVGHFVEPFEIEASVGYTLGEIDQAYRAWS